MLVNQALSELENNTIRINRWMEENFKAGLQYLFIATLDANREANGPPPVYIGFGSMVDHKREEITQIVINALKETNSAESCLAGGTDLVQVTY